VPKKFLSDLRVVDIIERPLKLYCDNEPTIFYAHNNKKTKTAKHINIRFYVVKEKIQDQTISLEHITQCVQRALSRHGCKHLGPGRYVSVINDNH
jgi:hypothetical protein